MTERRTETIDLGRGVQYAKVAARLAEFHRDNETCWIVTSCDFKGESYMLFRAKVTTKKGEFTGHSMAKLGSQQKQFEKQETIAVGRALAFAGYLASGDIACAEEMADLVTVSQLNSLKLKFAKVNEDALNNLDRAAKQQKFNAWARTVVGEDADYTDPANWQRDWFQACWQDLTGVSADVPFEE